MDIVIWVIAAILGIDLLIVVSFVITELLDRRRVQREVSELDALWRAPARGSIRRIGGGVLQAERVHRTQPIPRYGGTARLLGGVAFGTAIVMTFALVVVAAGGREPSSRRAATSADEPLGSDVGGAESQGSGVGPRPRTSREPADGDAIVPPFTDPPGTPWEGGRPAAEAFAAEASSWRSIVLVWAEVPEATGYEVERRSIDGAGEWLKVGETEGGETTFEDSGLESATTYFYRVTALTPVGPAPSDVISATTPVEPPGSTSLTAVATSSSTISLTWVDIEGETGYRIERSIPGVSDWTTIATAGADVAGYEDGGLAAVTKYRYRVYSVNEGGESGPSNTAKATTDEDTGTVTEPPGDPQDPQDGSGNDSDGLEGSGMNDTGADGGTATAEAVGGGAATATADAGLDDGTVTSVIDVIDVTADTGTDDGTTLETSLGTPPPDEATI